MIKNNNVTSIVNEGLCVSCGTCAGVCTNSAISMIIDNKGIYIPKINEKDCIDCGLCSKICPGKNVNFKELNAFIFNDSPEYFEVGHILNTYVGYAKDNNVRGLSQSGGIISSILIYALNNNIIDGAIVTRFNEKNHLLPETFIAKSKDEIITASKSKYCPVPTNAILNEIQMFKGRLAFVGLPCQIHGLRKLERINNNIRKKIVIHLGLFCEGSLSFHFQNHIFSILNVKKEDIEMFSYRDKKWRGWPGDLLIKLKNGDIKQLSKEFRINLKLFYTPWRCNLCIDKLNQLSDISFGDAWLPEFMNDKQGISMILTRTIKGENLLEQAKEKDVVDLYKIEKDKAISSQKPFKKILLYSPYAQISKFFGLGVPNYRGVFSKKMLVKSNYKYKLMAMCDFFILRLYNSGLLRNIFYLFPFFIYKILTNIRKKFLQISLS